MKYKFIKNFRLKIQSLINRITTWQVFGFIGIALFALSISSFTGSSAINEKTGKALAASTNFTVENSDLLSNTVTKIFIDSFNVKWFGTDKGISRYNNTIWDSITAGDTIKDNYINDLTYQRTNYGHEVWVSTNAGLSVFSFNIDGASGATTYTPENSGILSDTITTVGIDGNGARWIGTPRGISLFGDIGWDTLLASVDKNDDFIIDLTHLTFTDIANYSRTDQAYIASKESGVLRSKYTDLDGFTGASTFDTDWSDLPSNQINSIQIDDTNQWYGTENGLTKHKGTLTKYNWRVYTVSDGLIDNHVNAVELDNNGLIWVGTDAGLTIIDKFKWYHYGESEGIINPMVNDIKKDFSGNVWIATNGGVEYFSSVPGIVAVDNTPNQSSNLEFNNITSVSADISWTNGTGDARVVFIKEGTGSTLELIDEKYYIESTVYGEGNSANGWYCIYNSDGNSVTVTGLTPNKQYQVFVYDFMGLNGEELYLTTTTTGNSGSFSTTVTGLNEFNNPSIGIYPNPFVNSVELLNLETLGQCEVLLLGIDGKIYLQQTFNSEIAKINTASLPKGVYIIQIKTNGKNFNYKVVKK